MNSIKSRTDKVSVFPIAEISPENLYSLDEMRKLDYLAIEQFNLPVELMMENAGLHLAHLVSFFARDHKKLVLGIGPENNGGGALVAARRLTGWGFDCSLIIPWKPLRELPRKQLERALLSGAKIIEDIPKKCAVFVEGFFGFSQHLTLSLTVLNILSKINNLNKHSVWEIQQKKSK